MINILIKDARMLVERCMRKVGYEQADAALITDHLIDAELRGQGYAGLERAFSVIEKVRNSSLPTTPISITHETPISALIDGGGNVGYLVGHRATSIAIEKAKINGIGITGASNTWYTGMLAYYMEMATTQNLVSIAAGSSAWRVAPHGSNEARHGTNPLAFGFPSLGDPVILDFAVSALMVSEATQRMRNGEFLPNGLAFDKNGTPTIDPAEALAGAFSVWGGPKGSGLGLCIQLFGLLCKGGVIPNAFSDCSLFTIVMQPDLLISSEQLKRQVSEYAEIVRNSTAFDPNTSVRMPFDRSAKQRKENLQRGWIKVPRILHSDLLTYAEK